MIPPRATLSLNVIPKVPARTYATCVFIAPLSGVGGGDAYIDRTVDKMSFVIFVKKMPERLGGTSEAS